MIQSIGCSYALGWVENQHLLHQIHSFIG